MRTTMTDVEMLFDDLSETTILEVEATGLTMNTVKCPGASSDLRFGLCTAGPEGNDIAF